MTKSQSQIQKQANKLTTYDPAEYLASDKAIAHKTVRRDCFVSGLIPRPCRTRIRFSPNRFNKRIRHPMKLGGVFVCWWSRRESNPRPQALYRPLYILRSPYLVLTACTPMGGLTCSEPPKFNFTPSGPM